MDITLREIEEKDFAKLLSLFREFATFQKMPEKMINSAEQMEKEKNYLQGFVAMNTYGEIVGYATWFYAYFTWVGKSMYMDDLYVTPDCRGKGIGTQLINKIIQHARTNSCQRVRWQVSKWNSPALGFYQSLGAIVNDVESNCDLVLR